jgi:hypothetical protein
MPPQLFVRPFEQMKGEAMADDGVCGLQGTTTCFPEATARIWTIASGILTSGRTTSSTALVVLSSRIADLTTCADAMAGRGVREAWI